MLVYKFDLRTCVRIMQTMSIFPAIGNNFLENLSGSLIRILCGPDELGKGMHVKLVILFEHTPAVGGDQSKHYGF